MEQKEVPRVDKDSAEELVNDGQRCAVSEDTSATEGVAQVNEAKSEVKRCVDCSAAVTLSFCVTFDAVTHVWIYSSVWAGGNYSTSESSKCDTKQVVLGSTLEVAFEERL